jgi:signal transduction histidine kinase
LRVTTRRVDEFVGMASHELRSPLTSAKAYGQMAQQQRDAGSRLPSWA